MRRREHNVYVVTSPEGAAGKSKVANREIIKAELFAELLGMEYAAFRQAKRRGGIDIFKKKTAIPRASFRCGKAEYWRIEDVFKFILSRLVSEEMKARPSFYDRDGNILFGADRVIKLRAAHVEALARVMAANHHFVLFPTEDIRRALTPDVKPLWS